MHTKLSLILLLTIGYFTSSCFAINCTVEQIKNRQCENKHGKSYYLMLSFPYDDYIMYTVAGLAGILPSLINLIIIIIFAQKPLQRDPTPEDIEAIEEDEEDLEAKNKEFMKNMKGKANNNQKGKGKNQPMTEFAIKNENVNKEDDQTVPIQPVDGGAGGGQSAVTPSQLSATKV